MSTRVLFFHSLFIPYRLSRRYVARYDDVFAFEKIYWSRRDETRFINAYNKLQQECNLSTYSVVFSPINEINKFRSHNSNRSINVGLITANKFEFFFSAEFPMRTNKLSECVWFKMGGETNLRSSRFLQSTTLRCKCR